MEKLKAKHDHKLTDILKVLIFAIFLMLPFMVYCPNALYYGHNEHSTNERQTTVDIQYKYQSNEVTNLDDLVEGNIYNFNGLEFQDDTWVEGTHITLVKCDLLTLPVYNLDEVYIEFYENSTGNQIYLEMQTYPYYYVQISNNNGYVAFSEDIEDTGGFTISSCIAFTDTLNNFKLFISSNINNYDMVIGDIQYTDYNLIESVDVQENVEMTITESMNRAWEHMWETPMFNWTNESVLKQGLDNFTGVFGVTDTSYFTNLIVYELNMVAIYVVIDLVITLFTWLTHLIGEK